MSYKPNILKNVFHNMRRKAAYVWLKFQPATQIAITGSQGKTSTTRIIVEVVKEVVKANVISTDINLDTIYNIPITALRVSPKIDYAIFEVGIDHKDEMKKHLEIIDPIISVLTGISSVHSDSTHLGSLKNIIKEKEFLIKALNKKGYAVLNYDDKNVRDIGKRSKARIIWFGGNKGRCKIFLDKKDKVLLSIKKTEFIFYDGNKKIHIETPLIGKHHIYNIMAAYGVLKAIYHLKHKTFKLPKNYINAF